jgi:hypothetical protein
METNLISRIDRQQFDSELQDLLKQYQDAFPFWVKGPEQKAHPFDAAIIFVGVNPSSGGDWRAAWDR